MKRATVKEQKTMVNGRSCRQFLIFDEGIGSNGSRALVASGTLIGGQAGPGSSSTGFLKEFPSPQAWAHAYGRVLVNS